MIYTERLFEFEEIAQYLQKPVMDEEFRRQLEGEEEIDEIFDKQETKYLKQIEEARNKEKEAMIKLAKKMIKYGETIDEIKKETGLSIEEINNL